MERFTSLSELPPEMNPSSPEFWSERASPKEIPTIYQWQIYAVQTTSPDSLLEQIENLADEVGPLSDPNHAARRALHHVRLVEPVRLHIDPGHEASHSQQDQPYAERLQSLLNLLGKSGFRQHRLEVLGAASTSHQITQNQFRRSDTTLGIRLSPYFQWDVPLERPQSFLQAVEPIPAGFEDQAPVHESVSAYWQRHERQAKSRVLTVLATKYADQHGVNTVEVLDRIELATSLEQTEELWREFLDRYHIEPRDIEGALHVTRLAEELAETEQYHHEVERALRWALVLPEIIDSVNVETLAKLVGRNSHFLRTHAPKLIQQLHLFDEHNQEWDKALAWIKQAESLREGDEHRALAWLKEELDIPLGDQSSQYKDRFNRLNYYVDLFIEDMSRQLGRRHLFGRHQLDQLNAVNDPDALELLQIAYGRGPAIQGYLDGLPEIHRRVRYEAWRKLILFQKVSPILEAYDRAANAILKPRRVLWRNLTSAPERVFLQGQYDDEGTLLDVSIDSSQSAGTEFILRQLNLDSTKARVAELERPRKRVESVIRKSLLENELPTDIFARTLVIAEAPDELLERVQKETPVLQWQGSVEKSSSETVSVNDHAIVFALFERARWLVEASSVFPPGWRFHIAKYSPTPEGEDYTYVGQSPGSGDQVRMSKVLFCLVDPQGNEYLDELQIFTPAFVKSGFCYLEEKLRKDPDYHDRRNMTVAQGGERPLFLQIFAREIYGDIELAPPVTERLKLDQMRP